MSEATEALSLRETIARIDRTLDEAAKFRTAERKLSAEVDKFRRERFLAPVLALVATLGAIAALTPAFGRDEGVVCGMTRGARPIPTDVAPWLETLAKAHAAHPAPQIMDGRRRLASIDP